MGRSNENTDRGSATANAHVSATRESSRRQSRRTFIAAGSTVLAGLGAGCSWRGGGDSGNMGNDSTKTTVDIEGPIKLGAIVPLPGQFAGGTGEANAYNLLTKQINENGGLLGAEVEMIIKDSQLKASVFQEKYRELVLEEGVRATFGGFADEGILRVSDDISQQQKIHIAPSLAVTDMNEKINEDYDNNKYFFSTFQNGDIIGTNLKRFADANFVEPMGWEKVAFIIEDITGWDPIVRIPTNQPPDGVEVAYTQKFSVETQDFGPILDRAEEEGIDGMYAFMSRGGIPLATQWSKRQPDFGLGGGDIFSSNPNHYANTDGAVESVWTYLGGAAPNVQPTATTGKYINAHEKEFGGPPPHAQSYTAYDSLLAYIKAVENAGTLNEDDVVAELEEIQFEGTIGNIDFYPQGHKWAHDVRYEEDKVVPPIIQWQDGEQVALWPENLKNGEYQSPEWI